MNIRRIFLAVVFAAAISLVSINEASAYSYSAWVGMTGANTIAVNPFLSGALDGASLTDWEMLLEFGLGDTADIFLSFSATPWGMIRYDFTGGSGLAIGALTLASDGATLGYHMIWDDLDIFAFEANVNVGFTYGDTLGVSVSAIIAPTLKLGPIFFFVEIDPSYDISGSSFDLTLVPGLGFNIGNSQLSIGVPIGGLTSGTTSVSYGAWLWVPFSFAGDEG